jgi:diaminopimelate epimerase
MTPPEQIIPFVKTSACGNDFLIVEGSYAPADTGSLSRRMCDRHLGIGADGVEWLFPDQGADIHARLFNADGSEAEISGNGTRCVAAYLCSELRGSELRGSELPTVQQSERSSGEPRNKFTIRTGAGIKTCTFIGRNQSQYEFEIAMGEPQVGNELPIQAGRTKLRGIPVSMGNPHYVVFVEEFAPGWQMQAAEIGHDGHFQDGINVELVVIKDKNNVEARFFERGVGETQSSGTGSCAAAVAAIATKRTESPVRVHAPGGIQIVRWEEQVFLRGAAQLICRGEFLV